MRPFIVIPIHGADDLANLCLRSLHALPEIGQGRPVIFPIRSIPDRKDISHGAKLDYAKRIAAEMHVDTVICLDQDVVVWPGWWQWIETTLDDIHVGACGAPRMEPEPGLHPSMLAMPSDLFVKSPSFIASGIGDTGVAVCSWLEHQGLSLRPSVMVKGACPRDWWWCCGEDTDTLWWHLGSSTDSEWPGVIRHAYRMGRGLLGSRLHQKAVDRVRRRRRFIREAQAKLG